MVAQLFWFPLYLISYGILLFYGGRVCPYIEDLKLPLFARDLALCFLLGVALRMALGIWMRARPGYRTYLWVDNGIFVAMALFLTFYNFFVHDFPLASGVKVGVGFLTLGFFIGVQSYLSRQRQLIRSGSGAVVQQIRSSIVVKISLITILSISLTTIILFLVVNKDLLWLAEQGPGAVAYYRTAVLFEIVFVMLILLLLLIHLVLSYSKNLQLLFQNQTRILEKVMGGSLDHYVPVLSNDEFGRIATYTNTMIDGLKEKRRIQAVFGKAFSPRIAHRLLREEQELRVGEKMHLTVLMSDVRGFTTMAERLAPEELVEQLNLYFGAMVQIVHEHGGEVDKFIGDGMLAVFGLESDREGSSQAVQAARAMVLAARSSPGWEIGVGVHCGSVIAGRVGSAERQEYTFIGDTVNTAARLEAACKEEQVQVIVSGAVYSELDEVLQKAPWQRVEGLVLKGKQESPAVYTLRI